MYYDTFLTYLFMFIVIFAWFTNKVLYYEHLQLLGNKLDSNAYIISLYALFFTSLFWVYIAMDYVILLIKGY